VLAHSSGEVPESEGTDALLRPTPAALDVRESAERGDVFGAGARERRESVRDAPGAIVALARDPGAVEIGKHRIVLGEEPANSGAEAFALEVREVPDVLDEGKRPAFRASSR